MILRVILKNFLSFDDEVQFDMFANMKRMSLSKHIYKVAEKVPVLKMAAVYGANGAGKSNLLKGIDFLKNFTTDKSFVDAESIGRYFFAFKKNVGVQPLELTIEFSTSNDKVLIYSVEINQKGVVFETLQQSGLGETDNHPIFVRKDTNLEINGISDEVRKMICEWIDKNQFSSLLSINCNDMKVINDNDFNDAVNWFANDLVVVGIHAVTPRLISVFKHNAKITKFASDLFNAVGLGISDVKVQTDDFDDWISKHSDNELPVEKIKGIDNGMLSQVVNSRNTFDVVVEKGKRKISQMMFEQFGKDGISKDMDVMAQSDGTMRLLSLIPALYGAIKKGETVVIDEIDHSIHPHLVCELVRYFSSKKTKGQLIFTTHQTCLLNQNFIRTDEVWLVEKKDGSSRLYSLNDFKIHNTINIENGYLEGRYGAIPFLGELNM